MGNDLLDADLLHGAALLAVGVPAKTPSWRSHATSCTSFHIPAHVELAERDLHDASPDADLLAVAARRRDHVAPVDQRATALVLDAAVDLEL